MSCTARAWPPNFLAPTSTSRQCFRISSASNILATGPGLPRKTVRGPTTPQLAHKSLGTHERHIDHGRGFAEIVVRASFPHLPRGRISADPAAHLAHRICAVHSELRQSAEPV